MNNFDASKITSPIYHSKKCKSQVVFYKQKDYTRI